MARSFSVTTPAAPSTEASASAVSKRPPASPWPVSSNFATHPVGQDVQVRKISADYVGATRRVFQQTTGAPCLFWQGACGDIDILRAETDYANVDAAGTKLGQEAARAWEAAKPFPTQPLRALSRVVELPAYRCLSEAHAARELLKARQEMEMVRNNPKTTAGLLAWHGAAWKSCENCTIAGNPALAPPPVSAHLQAFRIGPLAWVCVPGELFNELGTEIKNHSPYENTFVVAYANDWIGYLPTRAAFDEGGYEVSQVCYLSPDGINMMVAQLQTMLKEL